MDAFRPVTFPPDAALELDLHSFTFDRGTGAMVATASNGARVQFDSCLCDASAFRLEMFDDLDRRRITRIQVTIELVNVEGSWSLPGADEPAPEPGDLVPEPAQLIAYAHAYGGINSASVAAKLATAIQEQVDALAERGYRVVETAVTSVSDGQMVAHTAIIRAEIVDQ